MIQKIEYRNQTLAIILRCAYRSEGITFFTPESYSLQLGYMSRPSGYEIEAHLHLPVDRKIELTNEVLFIKSGKVKIDFYSEEKIFVSSVILVSGDVVLLARGGHGLQMLEASEIIEVKQGPYSGEADKLKFEANSA